MILALTHAWADPCPDIGKPGIWARTATYLCSRATDSGFVRDIRVFSPDKKKFVHIVNNHWIVEIGTKRLETGDKDSYVSFYPAELSWSPDSKAFYITQSDATSEINGFHTEVFFVSEDAVTKAPDINQPVHNRFDHHHQCSLKFDHNSEVRERNFNIAALGWDRNSSQLLVVAEIPADSDCGSRGYFGGYLLNVAETRITGEYSPHELIARWRAAIGQRLRENYRAMSLSEQRENP